MSALVCSTPNSTINFPPGRFDYRRPARGVSTQDNSKRLEIQPIASVLADQTVARRAPVRSNLRCALTGFAQFSRLALPPQCWEYITQQCGREMGFCFSGGIPDWPPPSAPDFSVPVVIFDILFDAFTARFQTATSLPSIKNCSIRTEQLCPCDVVECLSPHAGFFIPIPYQALIRFMVG